MKDALDIRAAVFTPGERHPSIRPAKLEELRADEVLVRIVATGICHTDITLRDRLQRPTILGHEGAGIVERVGDKVGKVAVGDSVVLSYDYCGECAPCKHRAPSYCRRMPELNLSGVRMDGSSALSVDGEPVPAHFFGQSSFATYSVANERNVVKVSEQAPLELLGPLGCGIQTGAGTVLNVLKPSGEDSLLICGAGAVGLSAVMAARLAGCSPIVVIEPNAARRTLALELGAHFALDPQSVSNVAEAVTDKYPDGLSCFIDTSGRGSVVADLIGAMAPMGKVALLAANMSDPALEVPLSTMIAKGLSVMGVVEGESIADEFIPRLVDLHAKGRFPLEKLVSYFDFDAIDEAIEAHEKGTAVKPVVVMPRSGPEA